MFTRLFVQNPIFTNVIAIIAVILGIVSLTRLPIALYPDITPPTIAVSAARAQSSGDCSQYAATSATFSISNGADFAAITSPCSFTTAQRTPCVPASMPINSIQIPFPSA